VVGLEWYPCCRLKPATRIPLQNIIYIYIYIYERRSERRLGECVMERNCTIYFIYKHYVNVYLDDIIKDNKFNCSWAHVGEMGK